MTEAREAPLFQPRERFAPGPYRLLPFRFSRLDGERCVATNDVGEYVILTRTELTSFVSGELQPTSEIYRQLKVRHFMFEEGETAPLDLLALKVRTRASRIADFTGLHIFVVTLRCDHTCDYCQVSRQTEDKSAFDMTVDMAEHALALVFRSPSPHLKIEFQGGEPLLNFEMVEHVVRRAKELNRGHGRSLAFVIASNLARLDDRILQFCRDEGVAFSTSLDGPAALHDAHRRARGASSHALAIRGIHRVREALGPHGVSALMTTTPETLTRVRDVIDEYVRTGFESIFLRPMSPFGFATRKSLVRRYDASGWVEFYKTALAYILELNRRGTRLREELTTILLQKMLTAGGASYVDLQSPAGIGIGAIVYNYDGRIYGSDEGRMLAEMGDEAFLIGRLGFDSFEAVMTSECLTTILEDTLLESSPMCSDCAFLPYCGADPAFHRATCGDVVGHKALSEFCARQMGSIRHLLTLLSDDRAARDIFMQWVFGASAPAPPPPLNAEPAR